MKESWVKYFAGQLTESEKLQLFEEIDSDELLKKDFVEIQNNYALAQMLANEDDVAKASRDLEIFKSKIRKKVLYHRLRRISGYAAVIIALVGLFFFFKARFAQQLPQVEVIEYSALDGLRRDLILSDGTKVRLAPGTKIRIPKVFEDNIRQVALDGEALFDVTPNTEKPFVVKTDKYDVRVLGTTFVVHAYAKNMSFKTSLLTGAVDVSNDTEKVHLKPGECVYLGDNGLVTGFNSMNDINYLEEGIYSFEEETLQNIMDKLSDWYGVNIKIKDPELAKSRLSGKFRESDRIETLLHVTRNIHTFRYRKLTDGQIEIY